MSDYKRLTERNSVGLVDTLCKHCMFNGDCTKPRTHCDRAVRERLYELEDKIENGTLRFLPCKVGDTVYFISGKIIREEIVKKVEYIITNGKINVYNSYICTYDFNDKDDNFHRLSKLGKSLFLTEAEAKAKLKELQNER